MVDTKYKGSWVHEEFLKKHKAIYRFDIRKGQVFSHYEPIFQSGNRPDFGKLTLLFNTIKLDTKTI